MVNGYIGYSLWWLGKTYFTTQKIDEANLNFKSCASKPTKMKQSDDFCFQYSIDMVRDCVMESAPKLFNRIIDAAF